MIILSGNTDYGEQIGKRIVPITKELKEFLVFCRGNKIDLNNQNIISLAPWLSTTMKMLTGVEVYITRKIPIYEIRMWIFQKLLLKKIKKLDLNKITIFHSWDYTPKVYKYLKSKNSNIKILQDVAIAFPNVLSQLKGKELFNDENTQLKKIIKESIPYIDEFIAPSKFVQKSLEYEKIESNKIKVIPFGVSLKEFKTISKKNNVFKAAFAGNVNNRKGIKYLIEGWKKSFQENMELNIYGRVYPEVSKYFTDKEKYNIKLHGYVDLKSELPKNDIFVFPSLMEGSAKSVYEAMASGLVVITTNNAGSIIENKKDGLIVDIENSNQISEKITELKKNKQLYNDLKIKSLAKIKKYTWENYAKNVKKIYEKITLRT